MDSLWTFRDYAGLIVFAAAVAALVTVAIDEMIERWAVRRRRRRFARLMKG